MPSTRQVRWASVAAVVFIAASTQSCASDPPPPARHRVTSANVAPTDPLPSWVDGPLKRKIIDFIARTSHGADVIAPAERIAVFDNDGTLWQEKPLAEAAFAVSQLESMARLDPSLRERDPFKAALEHDVQAIHREGPQALLEIVTVTHTGMTDGAYRDAVKSFLANARHPRFERPYTALTYAPMIELLTHLRANGYVTYICSGGDVDFMRAFASETYDVRPEQVIGSRFKKELANVGGHTTLKRMPDIESINDKESKPVGIDRQIARRPLFAAGNVGNGGDIAMLRWTRDRGPTAFAMLVNHDDAEREHAYEEKDGASLAAAREFGFEVVSMKRDWRVVFRGGPSR